MACHFVVMVFTLHRSKRSFCKNIYFIQRMSYSRQFSVLYTIQQTDDVVDHQQQTEMDNCIGNACKGTLQPKDFMKAHRPQ